MTIRRIRPGESLENLHLLYIGPGDAEQVEHLLAQVPQRCGEEVTRVLTGQRPLHVVNPEVYAALRQPMPH